MKLKGIVEILVFNLDEGIKFHGIQENLIPDTSWQGVLATNSQPNYFGSRKISIATDVTTPAASVSTVTGVIGTCTQTTPVVFIENVDPPYGTISGQISPTGVSRTFYSVALTGLPSADTQSIPSTTAYARLLLDIPCTQGVADFVNITYSIQFLDNVGDGLVDKDLNRYDFGRMLFGFGTYLIGNLYYSYCTPYFDAVKLPVGNLLSDSGVAWNTQSTDNTNFRWNYKLVNDKSTNIGRIYNALPQGTSNNSLQSYALGYYSYNRAPLQTGFKHGVSSNIPFFDSLNLPNSQGFVYLDATNWSSKFPEFYKIDFTFAGATGVATYKFSVFKHIGFNGNVYTGVDNDCLYTAPNILYATGIHGYRDEDFDKHRLSNYEIAQFDATGVTIVDLLDGNNTTWDSTTTPSLPCTSIRQIAVDVTNKLIYVACRDTGLWKIDITGNAITNPLNMGCYGVDVGLGNVAIAIVNGGLYRSDDGFTTPAIFVYATITADWTRVRYLKADPEHVNDRIGIVTDNGSGTNKIAWYQFSDNSVVTGYESNTIQRYPGGFDVSDTGSKWFFYDGNQTFYKTDFATTSLTASYSAYWKTINHGIYGNINFAKITFYNDSVFANARSILVAGDSFGRLQDGAITGFDIGRLTGQNTPATAYILHMDSGLCLIHGLSSRLASSVRQIFFGSVYLRTSYGWNGSAWVAGNTNSKTTHTSNDDLINGLKIRFQDGSTTPHFVLNEFLTHGINYGLLKDNATDIEWYSAWYSKTIHNDTISSTVITSPLTLPAASDPYFRRVDTGTPSPHKFYIDGVLVTTVWTNGTAPAPGEISMLATGDGDLTFNAADIGKTLTGSYVWIEV